MHFVIAGIVSCSQFSYAVMVAQRLQESLPDFTYLKIPKKLDEWDKWLIKICKENQWYHTKSPLIWREIGLKRGKKDFIGDINRFLDLCYDYYGIPRDVLAAEHFNKEEMNWFKTRTESEYFETIKLKAQKRRAYRSRQVCITGACSQMSEIVIMELLQIDLQRREDGLEIRLFDEPTKEKKLASIANDGKHCQGPSGFGNCRVVSTLKEAVRDVDLVIVLDSFTRKPKETVVKWLKRNRNAMCALGKALNLYAPTHCRVIIGSPSSQPNCYNATVLASFATKLHVRNIVVVTQDLGREMLKLLSKKTNVPLKDFYCPPVWGFVGLNKYVDVRRTLQTHLYKVPGKRVNSTLPDGMEEYELRTSECLLSEEDATELHVKVFDHKVDSYPQLGRWPCLAKATAIIDLLKVWGLKQEDGNGEILCLGVYSDGTFNIPQGIYWSQPVILKDGFWVPFADFPIPRSTHFNCYYLFMYSVAALYRTKIKPRIYISPKKTVKPKDNKKFNFDKLAKEVGMPVIRTDTECVTFLKELAKKELLIDLDEVIEYIKEEDESEIIPMQDNMIEQIYCECWRQELKELQKIVFEPSSTTEVEVDLTDNTSGSEWSIINPKAAMEVPKTAEVAELVFQKSDPELKSIHCRSLSSVCSLLANIFQWTHHPLQVLPNTDAMCKKIRKLNVETLKKETSDDSLREENYMATTKPTKLSSSTTVCSCGRLLTGSICQCLGASHGITETKQEPVEEEKISTEHFYKEQNAQIFDEDLKDPIYADSYPEGRKVSFDLDAQQDDETGFHLKLYGKKNAVRDKDADLKMRKRISRYERGGDESVEEEGEKSSNKESSGDSEKGRDSTDFKNAKFQIIVEGASYDIIGDQDALERLEEIRKSGNERDSSTTFKKMYSDEIVPSIHVLPVDDEKSTESSQKEFISGEGPYTLDNLPEFLGEQSDQLSTSLEKDLESVWGEGSFNGETLKGDEEEEKKEEEQKSKKGKRKREGIPLCCLCRCLVPEGLPCCPCGTSTVVEVFKKESVEVFIQSEDDLSYRVEYLEEKLSRHRGDISEGDISLKRDDEQISLKAKELPPESFLPFSPKPENKFMETPRPWKLTKEFNTFVKKADEEIPAKCSELLKKAKAQLKQKKLADEDELGGEEEEEEEDEEDEEEEDVDRDEKYGGDYEGGRKLFEDEKRRFSSPCDKEDEIKTDFSDLRLFLPCGLEDWRLTVQKKYREWFFQGPKVKDEGYYDIAIEDVSEDEFEIDEELDKYFEK